MKSLAAYAEVLAPWVSDARRARIDAVLRERTRTVVPVCEGIYDQGNINAVLRSAESLGFQSVHVIETGERFKRSNRISQGADKWLDVHRHAGLRAGLQSLRSQGYRILATTLSEKARPLADFDFTQRTAIVFGNEKEGASPELLSEADAHVIIPMVGFTQSFNISVAAALALYHVQQDRLRRQGFHGDLSEEERERLRVLFYARSIPQPDRLLHQILSRAGLEDLRA
jgi:tRNA (guanosine-2'-O-)-methyltransferase